MLFLYSLPGGVGAFEGPLVEWLGAAAGRRLVTYRHHLSERAGVAPAETAVFGLLRLYASAAPPAVS